MRTRLSLWTFLIFLIPSVCCAINLEVKIHGVNPELEKSIRADLHLQQATTEPKLSDVRIKNLYQLANDQILATLQAKGYYNSIIKSDLAIQNVTNTQQDLWIASFTINLGPATFIKSVTLNIIGPGKNNPKIKTLYKTPKLIPGKIIVHENYEDTKDQLLADLNALGYLQAEFTQSTLEIDRQQHTASINFVVNTGVQYTFGKVTFIDGVYPDDFLQRFAPFKPGDPYELQKLIDFQHNLENADLFNKIRFDPLNDLSDPKDTVVPVNVRLTLKPKNRYTGSAGYGTDTGIRGSLGWLHRRTSTEGHKVLSNVFASQRLSTARVNYIIPGKHPATDKYVLGALGQIETFEELYSRKAEVSASKIMKRGKLETMYGLWYFTETFQIVTASPTLNKKYLLPTVKWIWIDSQATDDFEFGTRFDLKIRAGAQGFLSDNSAAQIEVNGKKIFPITSKTRFLLRSTLGAVASDDFDMLPPSLRFFAGGTDSVRGYAYNSLGPLAVPSDPDSNTGGRYLFIISGEVEQMFSKDIGGVVFFDAGNAALTTEIPLAMGTGVGIRYKTPIGNFRLDLAKPLNIITNKHWRVHVNFGTDL